ncbi:hypothetical protein FQR65_LT06306 [Abscondita terminalis]|nr:hypothetical protein FQR65_LT06306 [Abscondita terminalis]
MAQSASLFSSQRNFKYGDSRQERYVHNKHHYGMTGASSNFQHINQNEKKSDVYVHRFNRIPSSFSNGYTRNDWRSGSQIHQNKYKHEFSDNYNLRVQRIKKQFDNLNISPKPLQMNSLPGKFEKSISRYSSFEKQQNTKSAQYKTLSGPKLHKALLLNPENKAVVDKLEETYWSKWKPNKDLQSRPVYPKAKGLYTENETIELPFTTETETKERGDSNEGIAIIPQPTEDIENLIIDQPSLNEVIAMAEENEKVKDELKELNLEENVATNTEMSVVDNSNAVEIIQELPSDCEFTELKHTDSFILTSKKKSLEKPRFQQPKCIKLFKNAGYTTKPSTNYIKGGSYPLKSCLKKGKNDSKLSCLSGHAVTPVRSSYRRPGKANRFTT